METNRRGFLKGVAAVGASVVGVLALGRVSDAPLVKEPPYVPKTCFTPVSTGYVRLEMGGKPYRMPVYSA